MSAWLPLVVLGAAVGVVAVGLVARRRAVARQARRVRELEVLAGRLEATLAQVRSPPPRPLEPTAAAAGGVAPLVADRLPGRAAFLEAIAAEVDRAVGEGGARLTAALVRVPPERGGGALVQAVGEVTGRRAYAVGPSAVAFTLPGLGRADGLAALARIESQTASTGHAVEWAPGETAVELVVRLLSQQEQAAWLGPARSGPEPSA
jgi:hypothetical protein